MAEPRTTLWPLDPHTRGKHLVLKGYLDAWFPILGRWTGRILFIDGFAGPGQYCGGEPGSPIIALSALRDHRARNMVKAEVVFFFVEKDPDRAAHLSGLVDNAKGTLPANCRFEVRCGSFDATMTELLDAVDAQRKTLAPALVMVDPFGVSGTPMAVVRRILGNPRSEVYVSFMYEALNRFKEAPEFEAHLDSLFGTGDWRNGARIVDPQERKELYYGLYARQLRSAGATQVVRFELYEGGRLVYAIFFGSHSTKGGRQNEGGYLESRAVWRFRVSWESFWTVGPSLGIHRLRTAQAGAQVPACRKGVGVDSRHRGIRRV